MDSLSPEEKRKIHEEEKLRMELRRKFEEESKPKPGLYIALIGALVWVIGVFLPWVQMGILSASGLQKLGTDGYLHFVFAGAVFLAAISGLIQKNDNAVKRHICLRCLAAHTFTSLGYKKGLVECENPVWGLHISTAHGPVDNGRSAAVIH